MGIQSPAFWEAELYGPTHRSCPWFLTEAIWGDGALHDCHRFGRKWRFGRLVLPKAAAFTGYRPDLGYKFAWLPRAFVAEKIFGRGPKALWTGPTAVQWLAFLLLGEVRPMVAGYTNRINRKAQ